MAGPKKVYLLDEPTTGLDSSTAHQVVRSIRDYAHLEQVPFWVLFYPHLLPHPYIQPAPCPEAIHLATDHR